MTPRSRAARIAATRVRPDDEIVADERAVDVEGDHGDGQDGVGRRDDGHDLMMPDHRQARSRGPSRRQPSARVAARPTRARLPARDPRDARQTGEVRLDDAVQPGSRAPTRSTIASPWSAPISSSATPSGASASGSRSSSRSMTASPSGPPSSASTGSNDVARGSVAIASVRTYGRFASTTSNGLRSPSGSRSASAKRDPVRDRVPDRVLARQPERVRRDVDREDLDRLERPKPPQRDGERDGDRATPRPDVDDPERRRVHGPSRPPRADASPPPRRARRAVPSRAAG